MKKRKNIYQKHIEFLIKTLIGIYFCIAFIFAINENFEAFYINLLGVLMMVIPMCLNYFSK